MLHRAEIIAERLNQRNKLLFKEKHIGFRVIENVCQFLRSQTNIERKQDSTCFNYTVITFEQAMTIRAEKRNALSRLYAQRSQRACLPRGTVRELSIGESFIAAYNSRSPWKLLAGITQKS